MYISASFGPIYTYEGSMDAPWSQLSNKITYAEIGPKLVMLTGQICGSLDLRHPDFGRVLHHEDVNASF